MDKSFSNAERAEVLTQALPYIRRYSGRTVVIKYGGNAMVNQQLKHQVMEDIVLLWLIGVKVVLVHGGGPEINDAMTKFGKKPVFVEGLPVMTGGRGCADGAGGQNQQAGEPAGDGGRPRHGHLGH